MTEKPKAQKLAVVIPAGGVGTRFGGRLPKQFIRLSRAPILTQTVAHFTRHPAIVAIIVAAPEIHVERTRRALAGVARRAPVTVVQGGGMRQDSVWLALQAVPATADIVIVHDAARCLVEPADASAVLAAARVTGAALPVLPASDTVKWLDGDRVERTLERARVGLAQTPQAFRIEVLREALEKAERDGVEGTDCASLVERLGVEVRTSRGRAGNFKVTHPDDLLRAEALLAAREGG